MRNAFQRCTARVALMVPFAALLCNPFPGLAGPILGSAQSFAALGYAGVTNAHNPPYLDTQIYGNLGVSPGALTLITGFPPGQVTGGTIIGPAISPPPPSLADQALADVNTAAGYLAGLAVSSDLTGQNLGVLTLGPGVYYMSNDPALLDGTLTLDAEGKPNARFVFQLAGALTTASGSVVDVINGTPGTEVYWVLGSKATLGSGSTFEGNILAYSSISLGEAAKIECGRAFARTESVTLIDNVISNSNSTAQACSDFGSYGFSNTGADTEGTQGIPEPGTLTLLSMGLGAGFLLLRKFGSIR